MALFMAGLGPRHNSLPCQSQERGFTFRAIPMPARALLLLLLALLVGLQVSSSSVSHEDSLDANPGSVPHMRQRGMAARSAHSAEKLSVSMAEAGSAPMGGAPAMMAAKDVAAELPADATRTRLIETAHGNILVKHLRDSLAKLQTIVREAGGTVAAQNERDLRENGEFGSAEVTIRVPVEKFRATWNALLQLGYVRTHTYRFVDRLENDSDLRTSFSGIFL